MAHNEREINAEELFELISSISKYIEREIKIYALGGTALTILKIKKSTMDIDINIESDKEYRYVCKIFDDLGFERKVNRWISQEGLAFDVFYGSNILGTELLPDCTSKSKFIRSFGNIRLYILKNINFYTDQCLLYIQMTQIFVQKFTSFSIHYH